MASGDRKRTQRSLDHETGLAQNRLNRVTDNIYGGLEGAKDRAFQGYDETMGGYRNFAETGGFSQEDLGNIRSRALSPFGSVYNQAKGDIARNTALQGGYSPNASAAISRLGRDMSMGMADASRDTEAGIAQMTQQGKLAGLGGMNSMYGTAPGLASMYGNQALGAQGLQQQLGQWKTQGQLQHSQIPTGFQAGMANVGQMAKIAGDVKSIPWGGEK